MKKRREFTIPQILLNLFFIIVSLSYIIPLILLISISISSEQAITDFGYTVFPKAINFEGYKAIFKNPSAIIDAYKVTIIFSFAHTFLSVILCSMAAYPLTRPQYKCKKLITWYLYITCLFGGGMVPNYILNTKYLHLDNTIWIYIIPGVVGVFNIFLLRTNFKQLPSGLVEAAKIDGASEFRIFVQFVLPLSTPVIATLAFNTLVGKWQDWNTALIYIRNTELYSLQFLLQRILREAEFINNMAKQGEGNLNLTPPTETMRYAMAVLAAGPMMFIFPFFQKYFAQGLTIGSVKG